jgi:adenylate kinase
MSKQVIILFGPPGAGKGTQSELLAEKMGLYLFEPSKVLEREFKKAEKLGENDPNRVVEVDGKKYDALEEYEIWKKGELNSPPWVTRLIIQEVKKLHEEGDSIILSGSPRTLYEAEREMPILEELYGKENINIILIEISPEATLHRNSKRRICELMRHSILFSNDNKDLELCPIDGSKLVTRKNLDDPDTIKTRLVQYKERTLPLFEYFTDKGFKISKIHGEASPAEVHESILNIISHESH